MELWWPIFAVSQNSMLCDHAVLHNPAPNSSSSRYKYSFRIVKCEFRRFSSARPLIMSSDLVLPSTFFLTLLLMVGLFFFVRASIKDRTELMDWLADAPGEEVLSQVESCLKARAYRLTQVYPEEAKAVYEGLVRPSLGLAILLVSIVALGLMALSIVFSMILPSIGPKFIGLVFFAPLAGFFYWRGAERIEQVVVQVSTAIDASDEEASSNLSEASLDPEASSNTPVSTQTKLRISAHRDELIALQAALPYPVV